MKVKQIQSASLNDQWLNHITVETKEGNVHRIDLTRPYNMITSGPTTQDIIELVNTVFDLEHRTLQAERAVRGMNKLIDAYLTSDTFLDAQKKE